MIRLDAKPSEEDVLLLRPGCVSIIKQHIGYEPHPMIFLDDQFPGIPDPQPILCERYL